MNTECRFLKKSLKGLWHIPLMMTFGWTVSSLISKQFLLSNFIFIMSVGIMVCFFATLIAGIIVHFRGYRSN